LYDLRVKVGVGVRVRVRVRVRGRVRVRVRVWVRVRVRGGKCRVPGTVCMTGVVGGMATCHVTGTGDSVPSAFWMT
jgi:hypothetical protein